MDYAGNDIIFATGVPGSRWSRFLSLLGLHPAINNSDCKKFPTYSNTVSYNNIKVSIGNHNGAYFGPGNKIGEDFYDLNKLSKNQFLEEIKKPFENWENGIKIIKSHWFSYNNNLNWLKENFPESTIILIYNTDIEAFKWWHLVGGWNIDFPVYTWYKDNKTLFKKIKEENQNIIKFAKDNLIPISQQQSFRKLFKELDFSNDLTFLNNITEHEINLIINSKHDEYYFDDIDLIEEYNAEAIRKCVISIYSKKSKRCKDIIEFYKNLDKSKEKLLDFHYRRKVDIHLEKILGIEWVEEINRMIESENKTPKEIK